LGRWGLRVRDALHGFIHYGEREELVINSRAVQRLRRISQLGLTCYVYPCATHSRFEHSLGVMHLAGRIAERVGIGGDDLECVRLAGLLHDLGHGPFSHVSDVPLGVLAEKAGTVPERLPPSKIHERITADLIRRNPELVSAIGEKRYTVAEILDPLEKPSKPLLRQIVSGPLDADKLDYLLRDSFLCGVRYGVIDLEWLVDCFTTIGTKDKHLSIRRDGIEAAEQLLLARYQMTRQVYTHRVRRITDAMLRCAILHAAHSGSKAGEEIRRLYTYQDNGTWLEDYLSSDDHWLLHRLSDFPSGSPVGKLIERIKSRHLLKEVFRCSLRQLPHAGATAREELAGNPRVQANLEKELASRHNFDPDLVIVDIRAHQNPLYRPPNIPLEEDIRVVDDSGRDERLADVPESLTKKMKVEPEASFYVYAPVESATRAERRAEYQRLQGEIEGTIGTWFQKGAWNVEIEPDHPQ